MLEIERDNPAVQKWLRGEKVKPGELLEGAGIIFPEAPEALSAWPMGCPGFEVEVDQDAGITRGRDHQAGPRPTTGQ